MRVHGQAPVRESGQCRPTPARPMRHAQFDSTLPYAALPCTRWPGPSPSARHHASAGHGFRTDTTAREIGDQYMFGPAFLVAPVTTLPGHHRSVYCRAPRVAGICSGRARPPRAAPRSPRRPRSTPCRSNVRAGAIVPLGPDLQYTGEKSADPITLYVYAGADGTFTLYEDRGDERLRDRGRFAEIPLKWSDATKTLTIGRAPGFVHRNALLAHLPSRSHRFGKGGRLSLDRDARQDGDLYRRSDGVALP